MSCAMEILMKAVTRSLMILLAALTGLHAVADGIGGSGIARYFHSVVIDGVHFETDSAVIRINGEIATESDLKVGYQLSYRADGTTLQAWSMDYYDTIAGTVERVELVDPDMQVARIQIMNQRIETDADTWFHGVDLEDIEVGMTLAISAQWLPNGALLASSVDAVARTSQIISGPIERIDGRVLVIGGVRVDTSSAGTDDATSADRNWAEGEWIHASGLYDGSGTLQATRLVRQVSAGVDDLPSRIEGVLRLENGVWYLREHRLEIDGQTSVNAVLVPGVRATVHGTLKPTGLLIADEIRVVPRGRYRLDGTIEAIHPDGGAITVAGFTINVDERASLRDDRDGYRWLGPENLAVHDSVSLIIEEREGALRARRITRQSNLRTVLRARVEQTNWLQGPLVMQKYRTGAYTAREAFYNGRPVSAWRLRWLVRPGDAITLRYDDAGNVAEAEVTSGEQE